MPALIAPNLLATYALLAVAVLIGVCLTTVEQGAAARYAHRLSYHRRNARHASGEVVWPLFSGGLVDRDPPSMPDTTPFEVVTTSPDPAPFVRIA